MNLDGPSHSHITVLRRFYDSEDIAVVARRLQSKVTIIDKDIMLTRYYQDTSLETVKKYLASAISQLELAKYKTTRLKVEHQGSPQVHDAAYREGHIKIKIPITGNTSRDWNLQKELDKIAGIYDGQVAKNPKESKPTHLVKFINFKVNGSEADLTNKVATCATWLQYNQWEVLETKLEAVVLDMHLHG